VKLIVRDPPLFVLLLAIALGLPVGKCERAPDARGWPARLIDHFHRRLLQWRNSFARRA
jgi:hypothetical protein